MRRIRKFRTHPPAGRSSRHFGFVGFLRTEDLYRIFGVNVQTVQKWVRLQKFPACVDAPGGMIWTVDVVRSFLKKGQVSDRELTKVVNNARGFV